MGRIVDLLGEVAATAEEGAEGLEIPLDARERLLESWRDEDLDDAVSLVRDSLLQGQLVGAADSLSARMVEVLGAFGQVREDRAHLSLEVIGQLTRRVARLEEILDRVVKEIGAARFTIDESIAKVSLVGAGMKSHPGVAADMFDALASEGINIEMISTSSIRVSCVVRADDAERALRAIHTRFELDREDSGEET